MCMFANAELFELVQRQAKLISASDLIPKQFQGNVANCAIALEMASRLGASPFAVIQNLDVIHGRPSWRAVFMMGLVNSSGRFTPLQFKVEVTGAERTIPIEFDVWEGPQGNRKKTVRKIQYAYTPTSCIAWARDRATGEVVEGPPASYDMAIEEGWVSKDGSKWQTSMRDLMLRYRAASFFAKVHASDLMLGMQTSEELYDIGQPMRNVTPQAQDRAAIPSTNPYADPQPSPAAEPPADAPQASKAGRKAKPAATVPEETPAAPEPPLMPERPVMVDGIRAAFREAGIAQKVKAEAMARAAGLLPDGKTFGELKDPEMFALWQVRETVFKEPAEPPADPDEAGADYPMEATADPQTN